MQTKLLKALISLILILVSIFLMANWEPFPKNALYAFLLGYGLGTLIGQFVDIIIQDKND